MSGGGSTQPHLYSGSIGYSKAFPTAKTSSPFYIASSNVPRVFEPFQTCAIFVWLLLLLLNCWSIPSHLASETVWIKSGPNLYASHCPMASDTKLYGKLTVKVFFRRLRCLNMRKTMPSRLAAKEHVNSLVHEPSS